MYKKKIWFFKGEQSMLTSILKFLPFVYTFGKGFIDNAKHEHKIRHFDQTKEKINTIEHMITKLEKKISDCRNEIEEVRRQIIVSRAINLIMGILIIFLLIFLR